MSIAECNHSDAVVNDTFRCALTKNGHKRKNKLCWLPQGLVHLTKHGGNEIELRLEKAKSHHPYRLNAQNLCGLETGKILVPSNKPFCCQKRTRQERHYVLVAMDANCGEHPIILLTNGDSQVIQNWKWHLMNTLAFVNSWPNLDMTFTDANSIDTVVRHRVTLMLTKTWLSVFKFQQFKLPELWHRIRIEDLSDMRFFDEHTDGGKSGAKGILRIIYHLGTLDMVSTRTEEIFSNIDALWRQPLTLPDQRAHVPPISDSDNSTCHPVSDHSAPENSSDSMYSGKSDVTEESKGPGCSVHQPILEDLKKQDSSGHVSVSCSNCLQSGEFSPESTEMEKPPLPCVGKMSAGMYIDRPYLPMDGVRRESGEHRPSLNDLKLEPVTPAPAPHRYGTAPETEIRSAPVTLAPAPHDYGTAPETEVRSAPVTLAPAPHNYGTAPETEVRSAPVTLAPAPHDYGTAPETEVRSVPVTLAPPPHHYGTAPETELRSAPDGEVVQKTQLETIQSESDFDSIGSIDVATKVEHFPSANGEVKALYSVPVKPKPQLQTLNVTPNTAHEHSVCGRSPTQPRRRRSSECTPPPAKPIDTIPPVPHCTPVLGHKRKAFTLPKGAKLPDTNEYFSADQIDRNSCDINLITSGFDWLEYEDKEDIYKLILTNAGRWSPPSVRHNLYVSLGTDDIPSAKTNEYTSLNRDIMSKVQFSRSRSKPDMDPTQAGRGLLRRANSMDTPRRKRATSSLYVYWSASSIVHTLSRILKHKPPQPDTLGLRCTERKELCMQLYTQLLDEGLHDWKALASHIGLTSEAVWVIEAFQQNMNSKDTAAEIVLKHWQFCYNEYGVHPDKCPVACSRLELIRLLSRMERRDLIHEVLGRREIYQGIDRPIREPEENLTFDLNTWYSDDHSNHLFKSENNDSFVNVGGITVPRGHVQRLSETKTSSDEDIDEDLFSSNIAHQVPSGDRNKDSISSDVSENDRDTPVAIESDIRLSGVVPKAMELEETTNTMVVAIESSRDAPVIAQNNTALSARTHDFAMERAVVEVASSETVCAVGGENNAIVTTSRHLSDSDMTETVADNQAQASARHYQEREPEDRLDTNASKPTMVTALSSRDMSYDPGLFEMLPLPSQQTCESNESNMCYGTEAPQMVTTCETAEPIDGLSHGVSHVTHGVSHVTHKSLHITKQPKSSAILEPGLKDATMTSYDVVGESFDGVPIIRRRNKKMHKEGKGLGDMRLSLTKQSEATWL